jgi:hypothetical protein
MSRLVGYGVSQVPTNGMLGGMAYQDPSNISVGNISAGSYDNGTWSQVKFSTLGVGATVIGTLFANQLSVSGSIGIGTTNPSGTLQVGGGTSIFIVTGIGNLGIGTANPLGRLHIRSAGIGATKPSLGWPVYNAEADAVSRSIFVDTAGNGNIGTASSGATVSLVLGQYYDSRAVITPVISGSNSPSDQGTGSGKDLLIKGGTADNGGAINGGRLFLSGGSGYSGSAYNTNFGAVSIQPLGGSVGIGTTNPTALSHVYQNNTGTTPVMRIENTTATAATNAILLELFYSGDADVSGAGTSAHYIRFRDNNNNPTGAISGATATTVFYNTTSDYRLKEDVAPFTNGIEKVMQLKPCVFTWKSTQTRAEGFIAHEVQEVIPGVVWGLKDAVDNDGNIEPQMVDPSKMVVYLTAALQEAIKRIEYLESIVGIGSI